MLRHIKFPVDQYPVTGGVRLGEELADLAVIDTSQRSRILPLHPRRLLAFLRKTRRICDQHSARISKILHRVITYEVTHPVSIARRQVQEPLQRLRLALTGILRDCPPVLPL